MSQMRHRNETKRIDRICENGISAMHALLGAQRADVGSIRAIWAVQDKIALTADEETALELKREVVAGQVSRLMFMPAAKGLFHKVICQSGGTLNYRNTDPAKVIHGQQAVAA